MMRLPKFEYHDPLTLAGACQIMSELGETVRQFVDSLFTQALSLRSGVGWVNHSRSRRVRFSRSNPESFPRGEF